MREERKEAEAKNTEENEETMEKVDKRKGKAPISKLGIRKNAKMKEISIYSESGRDSMEKEEPNVKQMETGTSDSISTNNSAEDATLIKKKGNWKRKARMGPMENQMKERIESNKRKRTNDLEVQEKRVRSGEVVEMELIEEHFFLAEAVKQPCLDQ